MTKTEVLAEINNKIARNKLRINERKKGSWFYNESKKIKQLEDDIEHLEVAKEYISKIY